MKGLSDPCSQPVHRQPSAYAPLDECARPPYEVTLGTEVAKIKVWSGAGARNDQEVVEGCLAVFRLGFTF